MKSVELTHPAASERAIQEGQREDVLVTRDGRPVALVVPFDADDLEWYARERDPEFIRSIERARAQVKAGQSISQEQLKAELGL